MPLSSEHECIFVHIPRTGGKSFRKVLGIEDDSSHQVNGTGLLPVSNKQEGMPSNKTPRVFQNEHLCIKHMSQLSFIDRTMFDKYFKFAFVRNPWDKALSVYANHYHMYCINFEDYVNKLHLIVSFINNNFTFDIENSFYEDYSKIVFNTLWNKELDFAYKPWPGDDVIIDPHFFPQHLFTHDEDGRQLVDFIGRFENYAEDAATILNTLKVSRPIEKTNASEHPPYREMYNSKMIDAISYIFAHDIEMFRYEL